MAREIYKIKAADSIVAGVDAANLGAIFGLFLVKTGQEFLETTGHFYLFPLAAIATFLRAVFAWREQQLSQGKHGTFARALVEGATFLAVGTAVVGGFFWATLSTLISPIIFTATLGAKSLYHAGSACYYLGKSVATHDEQEKVHYRSMAKAHAIGFVVGTLATISVGFVMLAGKSIMAIAGVVAAGIGVVYAGYNAVVSFKQLKKKETELPAHEKLESKVDESELEKKSSYVPQPSPSRLLREQKTVENDVRLITAVAEQQQEIVSLKNEVKKLRGLTYQFFPQIRNIKPHNDEKLPALKRSQSCPDIRRHGL